MPSSSLEHEAQQIFGSDDTESVRRWVGYWEESPRRNRELLDSFRQLALLDFQGKSVLDIGCGTGGMAEVIGHECGLFVGADYHHHVLQFAGRTRTGEFLQCSGTQLPFRDQSLDYVVAFDVIEHLVGGFDWQVQFLAEVRRVLQPLGMCLLTTPNRWFPYEGHSRLCFPQYLPTWLADWYISLRNPGFLREHRTFREIRLLTPRQFRRALQRTGLRLLHDLPCGADRGDYFRLFPLRGALAYLGLGWYPHAEFWGIIVREESRQLLRRKLRTGWFYERNQPSSKPPAEFSPVLDFDQGLFNPQLGPGWYWHERDQRGFRWTSNRAVAYLETVAPAAFLTLEGYSPWENELSVRVDGVPVGRHRVEAKGEFRLKYLLPFREDGHRQLEVELACSRVSRSDNPGDDRELGVMIFALGLST